MKQYLRWNPETNTITGEMIVAREMKHKKEEKKAPAKSLKEKRMEKKEKHKDCK